MRKLKSKAEIEKLRKAAVVCDATMRELVKAVKPGLTEREAYRTAIAASLRHAGETAYQSVVTVGKGWGSLHASVHDTPLQQRDVLHVELILPFEGYSSRLMRCVVIGDIPPELDRLSKRMIELQDEQIAAMKPGAIAKDVDRIMRQGAIDAGIREDYTNNTGYTLGYYSHRLLRSGDFVWAFLPNSEWVLEEGMVFHMCTSGGGVSISETVLVGPNGGERSSKMDRRLFSSNESAGSATNAA